ncbi:MAG: hypothetical protein D6798_19185 [Deltaproteobacteria bacterium]|nr:MAG: hypothetical protein D6798_19185 [Deltaproteobacteria bacterium]
MSGAPARSLPVVLVWGGVLGAVSCATQVGQRGDTSTAASDGGAVGGALPAGDGGGAESRPYFWDLEPDTGWMSDYPVVDCPWPQEGDVVREIVSWHATTLFYKAGPDYQPSIGHWFDMDGFDFGDGDCSQYDNGEWQDAIQVDLQEGFHVWVNFWDYNFVPGTSEGVYLDEASLPFLSLAVYHSDGEHYSWLGRPGDPNVTAGPYQGVDPYVTYCVVRLRPKRIAGAVRIQVPDDRYEDDGFPPDPMDGLYFWWDIKQNAHYHSNLTDSNGDPLPCLIDLYDGTTPEEIWPDMPGGANWLMGGP